MIGQGDTIVIAIDGKEIWRHRIPETEQFLIHSDAVFLINLSGKAIVDAIMPIRSEEISEVVNDALREQDERDHSL